MRKKNYKGKCIKIASKKCSEICRTYDDIQFAYLKKSEENGSVKEIRCNVVFDDENLNDYKVLSNIRKAMSVQFPIIRFAFQL